MFSSIATITSEAWTNQSPKNVNTCLHFYLLSSKTMRGSLFPLLPLRVKCQNHERVPISPISPILVANVYSSCQDMGHQNRSSPGKTLRGSLFSLFLLRVKCQNHQNGDPFSVFPGWSHKTLKGSLFPLFPLMVKCQKHERVPISPISPILVVHVLTRWVDIGHQNRGNRGNMDPLMVLALHP